ncbi:MAG: TetR family transcriptional regulator C-terminal domain-containing protein [Candidatus Binatia bacterium]
MTSRLKIAPPTPRGKYREQLLARGLALMYLHGFAATGIQDITDASGVPKGSFYNYFKSKDEFGLAALEYYIDIICERLETILVKGKGSPLERLRALFAELNQELTQKGYVEGCFAGNMCQELADVNPAFRPAIECAFQRIQSYFTACLGEAQQVGELNTKMNAEELGFFLLNSWQGALLRMKASGSDEPLRIFVQVMFEQILRQ